MASQGSSTRKSMSSSSFHGRKKANDNGGGGGPDASRKSLTASRSMGLTGERTVKRLRLSKALTVPESTSIYEACRRMAARRVDALLLTDSNALLCGILTDKDLASRVIAHEVNLEETPVSKVMTRNPVFVLSDTLAVEALQKMVQGKFRHLPVVENGEVIALLDIAKCLYDAIARMERAAEKGKAIAAAVEGVEKNWGTSISGPNTFIETLRERMFRPALSTIIPENSKIVTVSPTETVLAVTKKMLESRSGCAVVTVDEKPRGIFTSKDILMRVIAQNLPPDSTLVEKVMTPNPECATIDTPIVDALHTMHDGKFLHLPVVDRDGNIVAVIDVIHITHAAVATVSQVGNTAGANNETANTMMQKFWDSAMALSPNDDEDETQSEGSLKLASEGTETARALPYPSPGLPNTFSFKIEDKKGRMHRFTCETRNLTDLITSILQRLGDDINPFNVWPRVSKIVLRKRWAEFLQLRKDQEDVIIPLIRARKKLKEERLTGSNMEGKKDKDVLSYVDTLLDLQLPDEKRKLNEIEMVTLCNEFLTAGTDTTTTALQWIMANLVKYPQIQEQLFLEIKKVVGEGEEEVKEDDLQKMPYLKAIILEGLRRHPPGHFVLPHAVTEDTVLGGYVIPKNGTVNFMVADMGWDPKVWEDPMAFKPERFLNSEGEAFDITGSREIKMMPFGVGRRICPGYGLAMLHLEYFVANLIWNFQWKAVDGDDIDFSEKQELTMTMKNPLHSHISSRLKSKV